MLNLVQKGYLRDRKIVQEIEARGALNTKQVATLFFKGKSALKKCQQRLKKLYDNKRVKRTKINGSGSYCYYVKKCSRQLEHLISLNWVYIWIIKKLKSWEKLWYWQYEMDYGILRCDAFVGIENSFTKEIKFSFIELDRSNNNWDKTRKYNKLYGTNKYINNFWVEYATVFPTIFCVVENKNRLKTIQKSVQTENKYNLRFKLMSLDNIIKEVMLCSGK